ncbi:hypothetical protein [Thiocapsa marina]|uniref:Glycosyltransferase RgtA/B/C/D-like domain-containing protein n=1 Tax=Thiocapsa marina 5811 TaxID=768671 RepID=F9U9T8_9GAMM|nr:hypothetical protein [Thiocapsa marina]EGV18886.1 hypothetical protein ThimaDRAFT_1690 [Thiocapsa marina 5811]
MSTSKLSHATRPPDVMSGRESTLTLVLLTLATLGIGLLFALDPRWGYDEAWHLYLSTLAPWTKALEEGIVDAHPPLHHLLLMPMARFGSDPFWFRLPSVLSAVATVPLWYLLLRRLRVVPEMALLGVVLLITSFAFLELAVSVRSYSFGLLFLVIGLLAATTLVPRNASGANGLGVTPEPQPLMAALALTIAFAFIYSALFVTLGLILALASLWAVRAGRRFFRPLEWIRTWRFLDWTAFIVLVIGAVSVLLWFALGYGRGRGAVAPMHLESFTLCEGDSILQFAWCGLVGNAAWLTPQFPATDPGQIVAVALFWTAAAVVLVAALWRRQGARVLMVLTAVIATLLVFAAGVVGAYPFGGLMRHQAMLLPLYLVIIVLALDLVWSRLRSPRLQQVFSLAVVGFALFGLFRAHATDPVGEAHTGGMRPEIAAAFACDSGQPAVYIEGQVFYPLYAAAHAKGIAFRNTLTEQDGVPVEVPYATGWFNGLIHPRDWDVFTMKDDCGSDRILIRDRRRWTLPADPDAGLAAQLEALKSALGVASVQLIRLPPEPEDAASQSGTTSAEQTPSARCPIRR